MTFEASYYEDAAFWSQGMVEDASNLQRLQATAALVPVGAANLLDVGCGNGVFARVLKACQPSLHVTCLDRSATALEHVQADAKQRGEIVSLPFKDRSFDCVTCLEVIEHLNTDDYLAALAELARVARQTIVVSVPYNEAIERNVDTCPRCRTTFNRDLHLRSFDRKSFDHLLDGFGFRKEESMIPVVDSHYLGFRTYYNMKRRLAGEPDRSQLFLSPLCPLCGYSPPKASPPPDHTHFDPGSTPSRRAGQASGGLKGLVKACWPKLNTPGYWIVGRFVRTGD